MSKLGVHGVLSALVLALAGVAGVVNAPPASGEPVAPAARWAPAAQASITPGVQMVTEGSQCTGNFVFTDDRGRVYVGYAAHCAGLGEATDTNGCGTGSHPLGTRVRFERGGGQVVAGERVGLGRLAYSSWIAMDRAGTRNAAACSFNDFALVRVGPKHVAKVNPTVPHWGGPTGIRRGEVAVGERVYTYGNSSLRGGLELTSPKTGFSTGDHPSGWSHHAYTLTPGIPGDSGSGFLDAEGRAFGTLSTVAIAPLPAENGIGDLARELRFAKRHSGIPGLRLVRGTEPFRAGIL
jgi:hypothetical protein